MVSVSGFWATEVYSETETIFAGLRHCKCRTCSSRGGILWTVLTSSSLLMVLRMKSCFGGASRRWDTRRTRDLAFRAIWRGRTDAGGSRSSLIRKISLNWSIKRRISATPVADIPFSLACRLIDRKADSISSLESTPMLAPAESGNGSGSSACLGTLSYRSP